jgi:hypothetical protein
VLHQTTISAMFSKVERYPIGSVWKSAKSHVSKPKVKVAVTKSTKQFTPKPIIKPACKQSIRFYSQKIKTNIKSQNNIVADKKITFEKKLDEITLNSPLSVKLPNSKPSETNEQVHLLEEFKALDENLKKFGYTIQSVQKPSQGKASKFIQMLDDKLEKIGDSVKESQRSKHKPIPFFSVAGIGARLLAALAITACMGIGLMIVLGYFYLLLEHPLVGVPLAVFSGAFAIVCSDPY